jgi:hypothetical protein
MTYDTWKATDPGWQWLGPEPLEEIEPEPEEKEEGMTPEHYQEVTLAQALEQYARALAELQKALQEVRTTVFGESQ